VGPSVERESKSGVDTMKSMDICAKFDITFRQLYYWTTMGYLGNDRKEIGQGRSRDYTTAEVEVLGRMLLLVEAGVRPATASRIAQKNQADWILLHNALEACR